MSAHVLHLPHLLDTKTLLLITLVWVIAAYLIVPKLWVRHFRRHPFSRSDGADHADGRRPSRRSDQYRARRQRGGCRARHDGGRLVSRRPDHAWRAACASPLTPSCAAPTTMRRSAICFCSAASRTSPSSSRCRAVPASGTMSASGCGTSSMRGATAGSVPRPSTTSVGLSHTTGQVTHHIAPDVDAERDRLVEELQQAGSGAVGANGWTASTTTLEGRNGGGDPWHTDGRLAIVSLRRYRQRTRAQRVRMSPCAEASPRGVAARGPISRRAPARRGRAVSDKPAVPELPLSCTHLVH